MELKAFYKMQEGEKAQIICFPYLGGNSYSFNDLIKELPDDYEIWVANPPGHFGSELALINDIHELVQVYYEEISKIIRIGSALYGHSMGGVITYFLAAKMEKMKNKILPEKIFLSAASAPMMYQLKKPVFQYKDAEIIEIVRKYNALPEKVLMSQEMMEVLTPIFRADFEILETAAKSEQSDMVDIETHLLWGEKDEIEEFSAIGNWKAYLKQDYDVKIIKNGTHMFLHKEAAQVASYLSTVI